MAGLRAVFLDRDGILNQAIVEQGKPHPPSMLEQVRIVPGIDIALKELEEAGYLMVGITNQPDVARGTQSRSMVESINSYILSHLPVTEILVCYHDDKDNCECRKPRPGLILQAARRYGVDLSQSWMVGDRWKDISAGRAAGLKTIFVNYHYEESYQGLGADFSTAGAALISDIILKG